MKFFFCIVGLSFLISCQNLPLEEEKLQVSSLSYDVNQQDIKTWVKWLASKQFKGRMTGSEEELAYSEKLQTAFQTWGLQSYGSKKSLIEEFNFISNVELNQKKSQFIIRNGKKELTLELGKDWMPIAFSSESRESFSKVIFAGYGIKTPESKTGFSYNSYQGVDVKGKWVVALRFLPQSLTREEKSYLSRYSSLRFKTTLAQKMGAKGIIFVSGPSSQVKKDLIPFRLYQGISSAQIPVISLSDKFADQFLFSGELKKVQEALDKGSLSRRLKLNQIQFSASLNIEEKSSTGRNILAFLPVSGATQTVILGAHIDHLGLGKHGTSLSNTTDLEKTSIHFGADDNASGVAAVLELAHYFSQRKNQKQLKSNLLFALWSGEELGLLGSKKFLEKHSSDQFAAYINLDMVGRYKDKVMVQGVSSSPNWSHFLKHSKKSPDLHYEMQGDPFLPTDSMSFQLKKVPNISLFTGAHEDYHTVRDTVEKINFKSLTDITQFTLNVFEMVAQNPRHLPFNDKIKAPKRRGSEKRMFRAYLGTIPNYTSKKGKSFSISGVKPGSPAFKAGLKEGDVILKVEDMSVNNIHDYVFVLQNLTPGKTVPIKIKRSGKFLSLKVTPESKH